MRKGGGGKKGGEFERQICKALSLWVSHGKRTDLFWRTAMSGGRATVQRKKGIDIRQSGDICSVSPEGHKLTDEFYIEVKSYKDLDIASFLLKNKGRLAGFWKKARKEARAYNKIPILIFKQNFFPIMVLTRPDTLTMAWRGASDKSFRSNWISLVPLKVLLKEDF